VHALAGNPASPEQRRSGWWLQCAVCGASAPVAVHPAGCPACTGRGQKGALVVQYAPESSPPGLDETARPVGIWANWGEWLPAVPAAHQLTLGEGNTPLLRLDALAGFVGCPNLYFKVESQNPTAAFKDRFHAVSVAVAATLGLKGVVAPSTGNHGLALAAYAAAHGLQAVVVGNEAMPSVVQRAIRFAGGLPLLSPPEVASEIVEALVETGDWLPATMVWPISMTPNPFGLEGYKTITYEIWRDLGGVMPDRILIPTAGGDLLTGIWRGQNDLIRAGRTPNRSRLVACQPAGAAPLVAALDQGLDTVPHLAETSTIALSIGDPCTGQLALEAVRDTEGAAVAVTDEEILAAAHLLMRAGLIVEPSSAAPLAGLRKLIVAQPEIGQ
jgi:threonine synthase